MEVDPSVILDNDIFFLFNLSLSTSQVLSMSRLGGAGAVAPLVTDIPISSVEVIINNQHKLYTAVRICIFLLILSFFLAFKGRQQ